MTAGDQISPAAPPGPLSGKWRAILIASLAVNLLVAGLAVGSFLNHKRHHGSFGGSKGTEEIGLRSFLRTLPKERASELRAFVKKEKPDLKPLFDATRAARLAAAEALAAEPFDKQSMTQKFAEIDAAEANVKAAARSVITAVAERMTASERRLMAEHWKARRSKFFHGHDPDRRKKKGKDDESGPEADPLDNDSGASKPAP